MNNRTDEMFDLRYDQAGMLHVLDGFPTQCAEAIRQGESFAFPQTNQLDRVLVCGMGGSAMAGDIARRFARVPISVNRSYTLPAFVDHRTLLVAISYSGNTAETISSLEQGIAAGMPVLCISSGGKLSQIARKQGLPFLQIPSGYQPRAAMGHLALPLLAILARLNLASGIDAASNMIDVLEQIRQEATANVNAEDNPAKKLARSLHGRVPIVYGTAGNTDLVAMRWKTQINENAKQPAYWNAFPELNHNEILALVRNDLLANPFIILLKNSLDHPENRVRMNIMGDLFAERDIPNIEVAAAGESELAQVMSQIYFGDYVSYYLALANGLDPSPVELIERFKVRLSQQIAGAS